MRVLWHHLEQLGPMLSETPWLVVAFDVAEAQHSIARLEELGAERFMILATRGDTTDCTVPVAFFDCPGADLQTRIRTLVPALQDLPRSVVDSIDRWDPHRRARVWGPTYCAFDVAGRAPWGALPAEWWPLDDKTLVDDIWDSLGVRRAPSRIVPFDRARLMAAARELDRGAGTVWAADSSAGWHAACWRTRHVVDEVSADAAMAALDGSFDARVMPFVEGIPCSVTGIVFPDHVAVLRPCEIVVLRHTSTHRLLYAGTSSLFDARADRDALCALARTTGTFLRKRFAYRGAFTIDGILGADGFVPTELNPRAGASCHTLLNLSRGIYFEALNRALVDGMPIRWSPAPLEVDWHRDSCRTARIHLTLPGVSWPGRPATAMVTAGDGPIRKGAASWRAGLTCAVEVRGDAGETAVSMKLLPSHKGPMLMGPLAADVISWADRHFELGFGPVHAARSVR